MKKRGREFGAKFAQLRAQGGTMTHLSLTRLSLLGGECNLQDAEELQHLKSCEHCARMLRWFSDEEKTDLEDTSDDCKIEFVS